MSYSPAKPLCWISVVVLSILLITVWHVFPAYSQASGDLSRDDLVAVARATTVLIGQDLERELFEAGNISDSVGSGVIIGRERRDEPIAEDGRILQYNYYVLTNNHVVADGEVLYGIRAGDGEFYRVNDTYEYHELFPDAPNVYRFGQDEVGNVNGIDLAVLRFTSDRLYPVAPLSQALTTDATLQRTLTSGWPIPSVTGIQKRFRLSLDGQILSIRPNDSSDGGYGLSMTIIGASNMSGGPVFDTRGRVIGIYGRAGGSDVDGRGLAIPINHFLRLQNDSVYRSKKFPVIAAGTELDRQAIAFGKTDIQKADNISPEEFARGFGAIDLFRIDPSFEAFTSLTERYGCLVPFEDGTFRPALFETRGELVAELNQCLDVIVSTMASDQQAVNDRLANLRTQFEALSAEVTTLRASST